jgi:hypothetical protein
MSMDIPHWCDEAVAGRDFEGFQQLQKGTLVLLAEMLVTIQLKC